MICEENRQKVQEDLLEDRRNESEVVRDAIKLLYEEETGNEMELVIGWENGRDQ
jgi:Arc/MetJ-type ribon-helix-helix transcriptional regulator